MKVLSRLKDIPDSVEVALGNPYGNVGCLDEHTAALCDCCQNLTESQTEADSRMLATWWERHQGADKKKTC